MSLHASSDKDIPPSWGSLLPLQPPLPKSFVRLKVQTHLFMGSHYSPSPCSWGAEVDFSGSHGHGSSGARMQAWFVVGVGVWPGQCSGCSRAQGGHFPGGHGVGWLLSWQPLPPCLPEAPSGVVFPTDAGFTMGFPPTECVGGDALAFTGLGSFCFCEWEAATRRRRRSHLGRSSLTWARLWVQPHQWPRLKTTWSRTSHQGPSALGIRRNNIRVILGIALSHWELGWLECIHG